MLDKKGIIRTSDFPSNDYDSTQKKILYEIGFEDTNKDGLLSGEDKADLFLSEKDGSRLTKITSDIDISSYDYRMDHTVFINYFKRNDPSKKRRLHFAIYDISTGTTKQLTELDKAIDQVKEILNR